MWKDDGFILVALVEDSVLVLLDSIRVFSDALFMLSQIPLEAEQGEHSRPVGSQPS